MKQLNYKANLAVRRCQTGTSNITVAQARNSGCIDSIVKTEEGYYLAENTLKLNIESVEAFVAFVEQFNCSVDNPAVGCLIKLQIHKHSRTFRKREVKIVSVIHFHLFRRP